MERPILLAVTLALLAGALPVGARERTPDPAAEALLDRCEALLGEGRANEALGQALEALALDRRSARGQFCAGAAQLRLGRLEEARLALEEAVRRDPELRPVAVHYQLGYLLLKQGEEEPQLFLVRKKYEEAIRHYEQVLARDPAHLAALEGRAAASSWMGEERMVAAFTDWLAADPSSVHARATLLKKHVERGRIDPAVELVRGWPSSKLDQLPPVVTPLVGAALIGGQRAGAARLAEAALAALPAAPHRLIETLARGEPSAFAALAEYVTRESQPEITLLLGGWLAAAELARFEGKNVTEQAPPAADADRFPEIHERRCDVRRLGPHDMGFRVRDGQSCRDLPFRMVRQVIGDPAEASDRASLVLVLASWDGDRLSELQAIPNPAAAGGPDEPDVLDRWRSSRGVTPTTARHVLFAVEEEQGVDHDQKGRDCISFRAERTCLTRLR